MERGPQLLADLQNGIGAGGSVAAGATKAAGIEHQDFAVAMAKRLVGVAVDHAVCLGKMLPQGTFDIKAQPCTVDEADGEAAQGKHLFCRVDGPRCPVAHIAMHCMELLVCKDLQNPRAGDVASVDDDITGLKTVLYLLAKARVRVEKMGIGEDACSDRHENGLVVKAEKEYESNTIKKMAGENKGGERCG